MRIIGFNLERTSYGLPLDNGGACLIVDGEVTMLINEERLNRKQYSAGFRESINYILEATNLTVEQIDLFVASSCLEPMQDPEQVRSQLLEVGFDISLSKIRTCNHHLSHAYSAYYPSGFDEAVVMVLDGDGNTLTGQTDNATLNKENYWLNKNEHNSYYVARGNEITLLERDEIESGENGFGGAYRYMTYFCGFYGYRFAGKLMGLSAYGSQRKKFRNVSLFELGEKGSVRCLLPDTDRLNSPKVVEDWFKSIGINIKARKPEQPITEHVEDVAFFMQKELDRALIHKVNYLVKKTGIKNLCISGGVGLNAVSNRAILDNTDIEHIFIQPAAGDSGQCLGNAFFGIHMYDSKNIKRKTISAYQGKEYSDSDIESALQTHRDQLDVQKVDFGTLAQIAAEKINNGHIIGWFQGRSEIGPRALGNRSILANPTIKSMKDTINARVKHRESFRPFAPSVLLEEVSDWFDITIEAPYMILNAQVKHPEKIPSVTHIDGSARIQTVSAEQNYRYHTLISEFQKLSGAPIVLNTSFNDNESIVESPEDAINTFMRTNIDFLFIGNYYVAKVKVNPIKKFLKSLFSYAK